MKRYEIIKFNFEMVTLSFEKRRSFRETEVRRNATLIRQNSVKILSTRILISSLYNNDKK